MEADADGDGRNNLEEFAFNTNPSSGAASTSVFTSTPQGGNVTITFTRRRGDGNRLSYAIETTPDLSMWSPLGTPWSSTITAVDTTFETVTLTVPSTGSQFVRVKVTAL